MKHTQRQHEYANHQTRKDQHHAANQQHGNRSHAKGNGSVDSTRNAVSKKGRVSSRHRKDIHASDHLTLTGHRHTTQRSA